MIIAAPSHPSGMETLARTIRLTLSYDGTGFHGWQVQPGRLTVQQTLTEAVQQVLGETVVVHASGRTDAGVHALGQIAHLRIEARLPAANLQKALNTVLPRSIRVMDAQEAPAGFHARRSAIGKLYRYRLYRAPVCPPFLRNFVYHYPYRVDEAVMQAAARRFEGEHDFTSFAATPERRRADIDDPAERLASTLGRRGAVRRVLRSELERQGDELIYEVYGDGFLHHMVRNLLGFLLEIGHGKRRPEEIPEVLSARRRSLAGRTVPARGLYLVRVDYPEKVSE